MARVALGRAPEASPIARPFEGLCTNAYLPVRLFLPTSSTWGGAGHPRVSQRRSPSQGVHMHERNAKIPQSRCPQKIVCISLCIFEFYPTYEFKIEWKDFAQIWYAKRNGVVITNLVSARLELAVLLYCKFAMHVSQVVRNYLRFQPVILLTYRTLCCFGAWLRVHYDPSCS